MPKSPSTPLKPHGCHSALADTPPGVWNPAAVGKVRGYAKTEEAYQRQAAQLRANSAGARARGLMNRRGSPNGWAGKRAEVEALRLDAHADGWRAVGAWQRNSQTAEERLPDDRMEALTTGQDYPRTDAERFAVAAAYAISVILNRSAPTCDRTRAARIILPFLKAAPAGRKSVTLADGAAWLEALTREG